MSYFESKEVYENLKIFFMPNAKFVRELFTSNFINNSEFNAVEEEFKSVFSKDFFICIKEARKMQMHQALEALNHLFKTLEKEYEDVLCQVVSCNELDKTEKLNIEDKLQTKYGKLRFDYKVDSKIIGGMVFKIGKIYYDASFSKILSKLKKEVRK